MPTISQRTDPQYRSRWTRFATAGAVFLAGATGLPPSSAIDATPTDSKRMNRTIPADLPAPINVGTDFVLLRDGAPYRGFGVNYFDCFLRLLRDPADDHYREGFAVLARHGIPFARFCATGFVPRDMELYEKDRDAYFRRLDVVVEAAEEHGVGLVPSLFWQYMMVPNLVGEPASAWGDTESRTHAWMRRYTREVVDRYRHSPAIWMWEMGNEYGLKVLLPPRAELDDEDPTELDPHAREPHEILRYAEMRTAFLEFGREVRKLDPVRPISTGDSIPRVFAWHQEKEETWMRDSRERFEEMLASAHPDPINVISVHLYQDRDLDRLDWLVEGGRKLGKPIFVGEFGALGFEAETRERFYDVLARFEQPEVALAALWVFGYDKRAEYYVSASNERSYQLEAIAAANRRMMARGDETTVGGARKGGSGVKAGIEDE